jgi:hypothetical protein
MEVVVDHWWNYLAKTQEVTQKFYNKHSKESRMADDYRSVHTLNNKLLLRKNDKGENYSLAEPLYAIEYQQGTPFAHFDVATANALVERFGRLGIKSYPIHVANYRLVIGTRQSVDLSELSVIAHLAFKNQ